MMKYKGYEAIVEFDAEAEVFHGEVINLRDVITFQGKSVEELKQAFYDSVDDYLEFCKERGEDPEKPSKLKKGYCNHNCTQFGCRGISSSYRNVPHSKFNRR